MKKAMTLVAIGAMSAGAFAQYANATNIWTGTIGQKATLTTPEDTTAYSNVTNFSGYGFSWGNSSVGVGTAGVTSTWMDADDITVLGSEIGNGVTAFTFSSANFNATDVSASPTVVFWDDNAGAPGNVLGAVRFNPLSLPAGSINLWTYAPSSSLFNIPSSGKLWMGVSWDDFSDVADTGITDEELSNVGQGIFDPPTVGSSTDNFFSSDDFGSNIVNNPSGATDYNFGGAPVANFGNELKTASPVPEPASMAVLGLGLAGLASRKRRKN